MRIDVPFTAEWKHEQGRPVATLEIWTFSADVAGNELGGYVWRLRRLGDLVATGSASGLEAAKRAVEDRIETVIDARMSLADTGEVGP